MPELRSEILEPGIVRVVIDNPSKRNAMTVAMWAQLGEIMAGLDADEKLRCVILRGAGQEAFCAGADIAEFETTRNSAAAARDYGRKTVASLEALARCRHPVIAAIHGMCVGGGLEMACGVDIRIGGAGSRYGIPVKRLGLVVAYDEMKALIDLVGKAGALRILLEGDIMEAQEALRIGLVTRIVPDGEVDEAALACARRIADGAPLVARWHKKFANRLAEPRPLSEAEADESYHCFDTEDFKIGSASFLTKSKPSFVGR